MPVTEARQEGTLAGTHEGKPGLPRGRSRLPLPAVRASQRERLLRSVIAAVSESGYLAVTVADIVRRARVSRVAFYAHFADKEECFLAATGEGRELMIARIVSATRALPAEAGDEEVLRVAIRAYLGFLAAEAAFARVFYIHMPAAGPAPWTGSTPPRACSPTWTSAGICGREGATRSGRPFLPRRTSPSPGERPNWCDHRSAWAGPTLCPSSKRRSCPCI